MDKDNEFAMKQWRLYKKQIEAAIFLQGDTIITYIERNKDKFEEKEISVREGGSVRKEKALLIDTHHGKQFFYSEGNFYWMPTYPVKPINQVARQFLGTDLEALYQDGYFVERVFGVPKFEIPVLTVIKNI